MAGYTYLLHKRVCLNTQTQETLLFRSSEQTLLPSKLLELPVRVDPLLVSELVNGLCPRDDMCTVNLSCHLSEANKA